MHQFLGYILTTQSKQSYPCVGLDFLLRGVTEDLWLMVGRG